MPRETRSYNNLIDVCIDLEIDPDFAGKPGEMFRHLLARYFFSYETEQSRSMDTFFNDLDIPEFISGLDSLFNIDMEKLQEYMSGTMTNDSLSGKIMLSKNYLKSFHPDNPPSFTQLHEDVKFELIDKIKDKNSKIISAFEKMLTDRDADKKRKIVTLAALIIRNLHKKTGRPLNKLTKPVEEILRSTFRQAEDVFRGEQKQMAELTDDTKIKELVKTFFIIKKFDEITEISRMFKSELERFKKRALRAQ